MQLGNWESSHAGHAPLGDALLEGVSTLASPTPQTLGNWESSRAGHVPLGEVAPLATSAVTPGVDEGEACASQYDTLPTTTSTLYSDLICMGTYALFGGNVFGMFKLNRILAPLGDPGDPPNYPGGSSGIPT